MEQLEDENMPIVKDLLASLESGDYILMSNILQSSSANVEQILATYTLPNTNKQYSHEPEIIQDAHTLLGPSVQRLNIVQVACFLGEEELALMLINHLTNGASIGSKHALTACLSSIWGNNNNTLHLASFLGMADLVNRILTLSPKLGLKKNDRGYRPVHCTDDPQTAMIFKQVDDMLICNSALQLTTDSTTDLATTLSKSAKLITSRPSTSTSRSILSVSRSSDCLPALAAQSQSLPPKKKKWVSFDPLTLWFQAAELGDLALLASTYAHLPPTISADRTINTRLSSRGATALLVACANGHISALSWILNHGGDPNVIDDVGNSALHYAVSSDALFLDLVLALIDLPVFMNMDVVNLDNEHFVQLVDQDDNVDGVQFVKLVENALELRRTKGPGLGPSLKLSGDQNNKLPTASTSSISAIPVSNAPISISTAIPATTNTTNTQPSTLTDTTTSPPTTIKPSRPPLQPLPMSPPSIAQPFTNPDVVDHRTINLSSVTTGSVLSLTDATSRKPNDFGLSQSLPVLTETYTSPSTNDSESRPAETVIHKDMNNLPSIPDCPKPADSSSITPVCEPNHTRHSPKTDQVMKHTSTNQYEPVPIPAKPSIPTPEPQPECHLSEPTIHHSTCSSQYDHAPIENQHDHQKRASIPKQPVRTPSPFRLDRQSLFNNSMSLSSSRPPPKRGTTIPPPQPPPPESSCCSPTPATEVDQFSSGGGLDRTSSLSYKSARSFISSYHLPPSATTRSNHNHMLNRPPMMSRLGLKKEKRASITNGGGGALTSPTDTGSLRVSDTMKSEDEVRSVGERRQFWMFMGRAGK